MTRITALITPLRYSAVMPAGFNIFRKTSEGHIVLIAWREDQNEAERLLRGFVETWPGEYGIRAVDSEGPIPWVEDGRP